jgi:hypothetical protein
VVARPRPASADDLAITRADDQGPFYARKATEDWTTADWRDYSDARYAAGKRQARRDATVVSIFVVIAVLVGVLGSVFGLPVFGQVI